jgi:hypothetical protein
MKKRLEKELKKLLAEKRGWHRALTSFVIESWGKTEKD